MKEHCSDELLSSYLDGDPTPAEAGLVAEHVAACPVCRKALSELRRVRDVSARLGQIEPPDHTWHRIQSRLEHERSRPAAARLPAWPWIGVPALAAAAALVAFLLGRWPAPAGQNRDVHTREQVANEYQEYVRGIDKAMSECEAALAENPGNARVQDAYQSARASRTGALDRLVSGGD